MFIDKVDKLLRERGMTRKQMLADLKMGSNQCTYWARGSMPNRATVTAIANYFGVSVDFLLGATDDPAPPAPADSSLTELEQTLIEAFRAVGAEGKLRIIQSVMNIKDAEDKKISAAG